MKSKFTTTLLGGYAKTAKSLMAKLAAVLLIGISCQNAQAQLVYGITDDIVPELVSFNAPTPGTLISNVAITGVVAGQTLRGMDFRTATGQLYAISTSGSAAQIYTVNLATAVATPVGSGLTLTSNASTRVSMDFDPTADEIRIVTGSGQNYRVGTNGSLIAKETDINSTNLIADIAYANNFAGAGTSTLYYYNYTTDQIGTINPPSGGTLTLIGGTVASAYSAAVGFDIITNIVTGENTAYLVMDEYDSPTDASEFYSVNLATGVCTLVNEMTVALLDMSITVPVSNLPVTFTDIKGYQKNAGIQIDWNVATESNINRYEIEKSANGQQFTKVGTLAPKTNNNGAASYNWFDATPFDGNNFFRIKAIDNGSTGRVKYTQIINVKIGKGKSDVVVYPNPVKDRTIGLQFNNEPKGTYTVEVVNGLGQRILSQKILHPGGSATQTIQLNNAVPKGVYQLRLSNGEKLTNIRLIVD